MSVRGALTTRCELTAANVSIDIDGVVSRISALRVLVSGWANTIEFDSGSKYDFEPNVTPIFKSKVSLD
jgi:hypothetical protein